MTFEKAYKILQAIAQINVLGENLHKVKPSVLITDIKCT